MKTKIGCAVASSPSIRCDVCKRLVVETVVARLVDRAGQSVNKREACSDCLYRWLFGEAVPKEAARIVQDRRKPHKPTRRPAVQLEEL